MSATFDNTAAQPGGARCECGGVLTIEDYILCRQCALEAFHTLLPLLAEGQAIGLEAQPLRVGKPL